MRSQLEPRLADANKRLLALFGIRDEPAPTVEYQCPCCGHVRRWRINGRDPVDAYLDGASIEYLEAVLDRELRWKR